MSLSVKIFNYNNNIIHPWHPLGAAKRMLVLVESSLNSFVARSQKLWSTPTESCVLRQEVGIYQSINLLVEPGTNIGGGGDLLHSCPEATELLHPLASVCYNFRQSGLFRSVLLFHTVRHHHHKQTSKGNKRVGD